MEERLGEKDWKSLENLLHSIVEKEEKMGVLIWEEKRDKEEKWVYNLKNLNEKKKKRLKKDFEKDGRKTGKDLRKVTVKKMDSKMRVENSGKRCLVVMKEKKEKGEEGRTGHEKKGKKKERGKQSAGGRK